MNERRFNEEEVAAIFRQATEAREGSVRPLRSSEGLTLAELQEIGRDVGIAPELVSRAASSLGRVGVATSRRFLGFTLGVGRTVELDRKLTDQEWERLVVDLRDTFDARGTVKQEGSFRQWTVGNLQVLVEPTANGDRIRLSTVNGAAQAWMRGGMLTLGIATVVAGAALASGQSVAHMTGPLEIVVLAAAEFVAGASRLPRWAQRRRVQMEEIAKRIAGGS